MYKRILVPIDGSALSSKAVRAAGGLARDMQAKVTALHVIPSYNPPVADESALAYSMVTPQAYKKATEAQAQKVLDKARTALAREEVECDTAFVTGDRPWEAIIKAARARKCDLIVMASHGRQGFSALLLGSETHKVLTHSKTPVLVCR
jgi:nucleotide-binding universal stress UspA family protein